MTDPMKITGSQIDILGVTPGITPEQPILLTVGFRLPDGRRVLAVKGLSLSQADSLQAQLGWSIMDWAEQKKEGTVQ